MPKYKIKYPGFGCAVTTEEFSMLNIFSKKKNDDFEKKVDQLVVMLEKQYPAEMERDPQKMVSEKRLTKILEGICEKALELKVDRKLGVIGTAKLANKIKWKLDERGYSDSFIDLVTEAVTVSLAKNKKV